MFTHNHSYCYFPQGEGCSSLPGNEASLKLQIQWEPCFSKDSPRPVQAGRRSPPPCLGGAPFERTNPVGSCFQHALQKAEKPLHNKRDHIKGQLGEVGSVAHPSFKRGNRRNNFAKQALNSRRHFFAKCKAVGKKKRRHTHGGGMGGIRFRQAFALEEEKETG